MADEAEADSAAVNIDDGTVGLTQNGSKRRRIATRTALACLFCRQRKVRCSGDWPSCEACRSRSRVCEYPGQRQIPLSPDQQAHSLGPHAASLLSEDLRRKAIAYFREHYAPTLLCFIPPEELIEDEIGERLPLPLLLSIIALVSKFVPDFMSSTSREQEIGDRYAGLARRELQSIYYEPSLSTIQSCLILCLYEVGQGSEHQGWLRLGHAIRLAQLLHLHKQDADQRQFLWGNESPATSLSIIESRRRTFWCCFCLDKLLANGRDRIAVLSSPEDIVSRLPMSDEDFIYGRATSSCRLNCPPEKHYQHEKQGESLMAHTIRIINILGNVLQWHGRGGRHVDDTVPWLPEMPFTTLDQSLQQWRMALPPHLDYTSRNMSLVIATGQGRLWLQMFLYYFQARAYLHREYLPFMPLHGYDPTLGPCDGLPLMPANSIPPIDWWRNSAFVMIDSAKSIVDIYSAMDSRNLSATAYPFPGLCLLTAGSIFVQCTIFQWKSVESVVSPSSSRQYLQRTMEAFHSLGKHWYLAKHWIHHLSLYYKLNRIARNSWDSGIDPSQNMNVSEIKDGIMNYIRQMNRDDTTSHESADIDSKFDFEAWLAILENAGVESAQPPEIVHSGIAQLLNAAEAFRREDTDMAKQSNSDSLNTKPSTIAPLADIRNLGNEPMFDNGWWESWDIGDWDPTFFG
ncbi:transcriptional regulatory protein PB1A11.04c 1 [Phlyctema vagabunda]|uniref:Transcriptional regulatory protein PB1A11.04c 1 n=1 Tax=Phlyctema vagabunda TaxID=108571 RepID=A0ABR4PV19_9HELO